MPDRASFVLSRRHRRENRQASRRQRRLMGGVGLGIVVSIVLAVLILLGALAYADLTRDLPNIALLPALLNPPDGLLLQPTRVYDRTGQDLLYTFDSASSGTGNAEPSFRRYIPLSAAAPQHLPDFLARATVIMADPGFWSNGGYTLAGLNDPDAHPTIAQKLVSDLLLYGEQPSLRRALRERILAAQVTSEYGHSQVLEWYLNSADYGHYAFGANAAAELYYGVPATDLTPAQSAVLAATSQTPGLNPFDAPDMALERGRATIQLMEQYSLVNSADAKSALASPPMPVSQNGSSAGPRRYAAGAGPLISLVLRQLDAQFTRERIVRGGLSITTTMDYDLQQAVSCATSGISAPGISSCNANPAPSIQPSSINSPRASLVLDPHTGQILAADGSGVDSAAFTAAHDPGTMLASFVYLTAFTRGFGPGSLVWDIPPSSTAAAGESATTAPASAAASGGQNAVYHGPVRMRIALANDYLGAEQRLAAEMGSDAISRTEVSFGLPSGDSLPGAGSSPGSSAALQPTLLEIASAYGVFAANGVRYGLPGPTAVLRVDGLDHSVWLDLSNPQAQPVVTPALAYLMNNVLSDESARWPTLGHPNSLELDRPVGVKLGQSSDGGGSWGIGYTPSRLVAVWVGSRFSSAGQALQPSSPAAGSQQLLSSLLLLAIQGQPADGWAAPPDVKSVDVCDPSGQLPTKDCPSTVTEVFLSGNEPVQTDTLFRTYTINRETGLLATVFTPADLVQDKVFMLVPPEAQDWAKAANIPVAPETYDAIQAPPINPDVHISTPAMFSDVSGKVSFRGTASGENFDHYRLLVGQGLNPQSWIQVGTDSTTRIVDGLLGTWDTTGLSGLYAVELQVIRTDQTIDAAITQVQIAAK